MEIKLNSLHNTDCFDILPHIKTGSIDMVLTDLPYAIPGKKFTDNEWDKPFDLEKLWIELKRVVKQNGVIVMNGTQPFSSVLVMSNLKQYKYSWVYVKGNTTGFLNAKKQPLRAYEEVLIFYNGKGQPTYNPQLRPGKPYTTTRGHMSTNYRIHDKKTTTVNDGWRYPINVLYHPEATSKLHPTQKSEKLYSYFISTYTNSGETVLDVCAGSMTTAASAINTGRNYICIEMNKEYFDKGEQRINYLYKDKINHSGL